MQAKTKVADQSEQNTEQRIQQNWTEKQDLNTN